MRLLQFSPEAGASVLHLKRMGADAGFTNQVFGELPAVPPKHLDHVAYATMRIFLVQCQELAGLKQGGDLAPAVVQGVAVMRAFGEDCAG